MRDKLRYKDKLTSEMGENPNASIMNILTQTSEMGENPLESKMNNVSPLKNVKMKSELKDELVEYLHNEILETLTQISNSENKFRIMWDTNDYDEESKQWANEVKEQWGKLSLIMKLFKDFNLDEGRNRNMFKESKIGGDCFYSVENYEVKIDDRNLSLNKFF